MRASAAVIKSIAAAIKRQPELESTLGDHADLVDEVEFDSLEMLQFMLEVEARLQVQIDFDKLELHHLKDIARLVGFLETMPSREPVQVLAE